MKIQGFIIFLFIGLNLIAEDKPNILAITDDLGWADVGYHAFETTPVARPSQHIHRPTSSCQRQSLQIALSFPSS